MKKVITLFILLSLVSLTLAYVRPPVFRIGAMYSGPISDFGFNYLHEISRTYAVQSLQSLGYNITSEFLENVPANGSDTIMAELASRNDVVIVPSYDHLEGLFYLPQEMPRVKFISPAPFIVADNHMAVQPRAWQGWYLAGLACGLLTKNNKLGFVAPMPFAEVYAQVNGFIIGALETNPNIEVSVVWVNAWLDPLVSKFAAQKLTEEVGIDCAGAIQDDITAMKYMADNGTWVVGWEGDKRFFAGENVAMSIFDDKKTIYTKVLREYYENGTFPGKLHYLSGLHDGGISLSDFSSRVPQAIQEFVLARYHNLTAFYAPQDHFNISDVTFCSPHKFYSAGVELIPESNSCLSTAQIYLVDHFVTGGTLYANLSRDDVLKYLFVEWNAPLGIVIAVFCFIFIAICILATIDFIIYRETKVVRAASPLFCVLILVGGIMGFTSALMFLGRPSTDLCLSRVWLSGLAFAMVYSNLIAKNYRLYRIFQNDNLSIFAISNRDLVLKGVLPIVLIELIILILWTALDPYSSVLDTTSQLLAEDEINVRCQSSHQWGIAIFLTYKLVLLVLGAFISYNTKDLVEHFKESQGIGLGIYNALLIAAIGISIVMIVPFSVTLEAAIIGFAIIIIFAAVVGFLFGPKLYRLHVIGDKEKYELGNLSVQKRTSTSPHATGLTPFKGSSTKGSSTAVHHSINGKNSVTSEKDDASSTSESDDGSDSK